MMSEPLAFFDVDTQEDFMLPTGKLYVPGAEQIIPNLAKLMVWARARGIPVLSSADAHSPDDPEFALWPPHCVLRTPGQRRIPETQFPDAMVVPSRPGAFALPAHWPAQIIIEKPTYDTAANPNFDSILKALGHRRYVVFGVATEYCVRADVLALRERGFSVDLVLDAIKAITEEGGRKAIDEMLAADARLVRTAEVCAPSADDTARGR
jgi:nicotinamidase/pyrazinamidase